MEERPLPATDCAKFPLGTWYIFSPRRRFPPPPRSPPTPWVPRGVPIHRSCGSLPLHPRCIGPVGAVRGYLLLFQRPIHEDLLLPNKGGGRVIHLHNSLLESLCILRNFAISGNIAKMKLFSDMKKHKTITVQIS